MQHCLKYIGLLLFFFIEIQNVDAQRKRDVLLGDTAIAAYPLPFYGSTATFGLPVAIGSWILRSEDRNYSKRLNGQFFDGKERWYNTPIALLPLTSVYAMKLAGVPSKSDWKRLAVSNVSSAAIGVGITALVKSWTNSTSPDGSSRHSFPSDHALVAYTSAAILDEEYGHLSPWVTIGGYGVATLSSLMRVHANKHWVGDIIYSFNLGNALAKVGYSLGDLLTGGRHINLIEKPFFIDFSQKKPSYIGFYNSAVVSLKHCQYEGTDFYMKTGCASGIEGVWFWNRHFGVGGKTGVSYFLPKINKSVHNFSMDYLDTEVGMYYSSHLKGRWTLGAHLLGGGHWLTDGDKELKALNINLRELYNVTAGTSIDYTIKRNLSSRFFIDYSYCFDHFSQQRLSIGLSTCYMFR